MSAEKISFDTSLIVPVGKSRAVKQELRLLGTSEWLAVFEQGGKKLIYIAESHGTLASFNMINDLMARVESGKMERPGAVVVEFERDGLKCGKPVRNLQSLSSRIEKYKNGDDDNESMNTLEYMLALANDRGIKTVMADLADEDMSMMLENLTGTKIDDARLNEILGTDLSVLAYDAKSCASDLPESYLLAALRRFYPNGKFDKQKLAEVLNAGTGGKAGVLAADLMLRKMWSKMQEFYPNENFKLADVMTVISAGLDGHLKNAELAAQISNKRDAFMLSEIAKAMNEHNVVWAHFGSGHFLSQYGALCAVLGQPKITKMDDVKNKSVNNILIQNKGMEI